MSFIRKLVKNNITYLYEVTSYRDENGKPRNKQKYLGRLADDGETLIVSKRRFKSSYIKKLPKEIKKVSTITTKIRLS